MPPIYLASSDSYITSTTGGTVPWIGRTNVEVKTKDQIVGLINARINDYAQKAARLARLREFFESLTSKQEDIVKDFWETVKKELD